MEPTPPSRGIPFRAMVPNGVTALALCFGLSGVRFAVGERWELALACIVFAGVLDGMDGRIARALKAQSKFGAELDSLSDNIAFGTAPALIIYLWSLQFAPKFGWTVALALAVCCALRLARFNARIDVDHQPHKSAGFNTGVPAPAGAGLAFVPIYLWLISGEELFRSWTVMMPWTLFIALLMISSAPTFSWSSIRIRRGLRIFALAGVALLGAALLSEPWTTLLALSALYLIMLPFSIASYGRVVPLVAERGCPYVAMHWRGHSTQMQSRAVYADVVGEVCAELAARRDAILAAGVAPERLVLDPGLGFAKHAPHNWTLLAHLDALVALGQPLLVGASRKTFLGRIGVPEGADPRPPTDRDVATAVTSVVCAEAGVWGVRVHDVAATRDAFAVLREVAAHR